MKLSSREIKRGWWIEPRSTIPCAVIADGTLVFFNLSDAAETLFTHYPSRVHRGITHWYFNSSYDRIIAEQYGDRVACNPRVLWDHFMKAVV